MIRRCLFVVVFIIGLKMPVNGATKATLYHHLGSKTEVEADSKPELPQRMSSDCISMVIAVASANQTKYHIPIFNVNKFRFIPLVMLFMGEDENDESSLQLVEKHFWVFILIFLLGLLVGYIIRDTKRHWDSGHRRNPRRDDSNPWSYGESIGLDRAQSNFPQNTVLPGTATPKKENTKSTTIPGKESTQENGKSEKEKTQGIATPGNENTPEGEPVVVVFEGDDLKSNGPNNKMTKKNPVNTLYFPNPNNDGNFRQSDGRGTFLEAASIYKFTLTSENKAHFEFCQDKSSVAIALNNRNEMILSVADEANAYNPNAHKILLEDDSKYGVATLDAATWTVIKKAKIKYV